MFAEAGITLDELSAVGLGDEDPSEADLEVFDTFEENARAKARWFASRLPGTFVVADDSGLEVDALGGAPGVRSKRWSSSGASGAMLEAANNTHLLAALGGVAARTATYVCVVVCVVVCTDGVQEWSARGECRGRILTTPRGAGGFGYDPLFWSDDLERTFAQATRDEKAGVSHRGRAFNALLRLLRTQAAPE